MSSKISNAIVFLLLLASNLLAFKPEEGYGLLNAINPKYFYLSPIHGINWWENKIVENMYRFGNKTIVNPNTGQIIHTGDATIDLIFQLFHLDENNVTFHPTAGKRQPAFYFTPTTIGRILDTIEKSLPTINNTNTQGKLKKELLEIISDVFTDTIGNLKNLHRSTAFKNFPTVIVNSLLEQQTAEKYLPYTTHLIFLTYLAAKFDFSEKAFIEYLKVFEPRKIINFEQFQKKYSAKDFEQFRQNLVNNSEKAAELIAQNYELASLTALYDAFNTPYPRLIPQRYNLMYKGQRFADCGETSLRNFFNILLFNAQNKTFDIARLSSSASLNTNLANFYGKYKEAYSAAITSNEAYHDWLQVVSSIKGIGYVHAPLACEIAPGLKNMLKLIDFLLFGANTKNEEKPLIDQIDNIIKAVSSPNLKLSLHSVELIDPRTRTRTSGSPEDLKKNVNIALVFDVTSNGGTYSFTWEFWEQHFEITPFIAKENKENIPIANNINKSLNSSNLLQIIGIMGWYTNFPWELGSGRPVFRPNLQKFPLIFFSVLKNAHTFIDRFFVWGQLKNQIKNWAVESENLMNSFPTNITPHVFLLLSALLKNKEESQQYSHRVIENTNTATLLQALERLIKIPQYTQDACSLFASLEPDLLPIISQNPDYLPTVFRLTEACQNADVYLKKLMLASISKKAKDMQFNDLVFKLHEYIYDYYKAQNVNNISILKSIWTDKSFKIKLDEYITGKPSVYSDAFKRLLEGVTNTEIPNRDYFLQLIKAKEEEEQEED